MMSRLRQEGVDLIKDDENEELRVMAEAGYSLFRASLNHIKYVRLRNSAASYADSVFVKR